MPIESRHIEAKKNNSSRNHTVIDPKITALIRTIVSRSTNWILYQLKIVTDDMLQTAQL